MGQHPTPPITEADHSEGLTPLENSAIDHSEELIIEGKKKLDLLHKQTRIKEEILSNRATKADEDTVNTDNQKLFC